MDMGFFFLLLFLPFLPSHLSSSVPHSRDDLWELAPVQEEEKWLPAWATGWRTRTWATPEACPKQYLAVSGVYGRFTNNVLIFTNLVKLGLMTNRTVVVPPSGSSGFASVFDLDRFAAESKLCIMKTRGEITTRVKKTLRSRKVYGPNYNHRVRSEVLRGSVSYLRRIVNTNTSSFDLLELVARDVYYFAHEASHFAGRWELWPTTVTAFLPFRAEIRSAAHRFISEHLQPPYLAYHMRWLEGHCIPKLNAFPLELPLCNMSLGLLSQIEVALGFTPLRAEETATVTATPTPTPVPLNITSTQAEAASSKSVVRTKHHRGNRFLASDGQLVSLESTYIAEGFLVVNATALLERWGLPLPSGMNPGTFAVALDMCLLAEASIFIGNACSSFAAFVCRDVRRKGNKCVVSWGDGDGEAV